MLPFPSPSGVRAAADLLRRRVVSTPVLESRLLNAELGGGRLLVKAECLQHTGSFKYRGALHRLIRLQADDPEAAVRGVVAFSSGNFGVRRDGGVVSFDNSRTRMRSSRRSFSSRISATRSLHERSACSARSSDALFDAQADVVVTVGTTFFVRSNPRFKYLHLLPSIFDVRNFNFSCCTSLRRIVARYCA